MCRLASLRACSAGEHASVLPGMPCASGRLFRFVSIGFLLDTAGALAASSDRVWLRESRSRSAWIAIAIVAPLPGTVPIAQPGLSLHGINHDKEIPT